jgi:hypothetical protein
MSRRRNWRSVTRSALAVGTLIVLAGLLAGCETAPVSTGTGTSVAASTVPTDQRVVSYPTGRYELRGDGTAVAPYYWIWVPASAPATVAAPPPAPAVVAVPSGAVVTPTDRVREYPGGQYQLKGDGTAASPYYWVWVPAGSTPPPPPPLPRR